MSNEAKLRTLLAEAREAMVCAECGEYVDGDVRLRERIDAALAEPVGDALEWQTAITKALSESQERLADEVREARRERDEAQAEVERLKESNRLLRHDADKEWGAAATAIAAAYQRGAEAMREAAAGKAYTTLSLHDEPCRRSELRQAVVNAIEALPLPEEKP